MKPLTRAGLALSAAAIAAPVVGKIAFVCGTYSIGNGEDGQAGIGSFVGSIYFGLVGAILAASFMVWWTWPNRTRR